MKKRQQRAAVTAEQLLNGAREVFEARGYQGTTVGAITDAANTAHGTFYLYFRNKEDAFAKVMAQAIEELYEEAEASWRGDLRATLARSIAGFLDVFRSHQGLWRCLLEGMHQSTAIERMWLDLRRPFVERIERTLSYLAERGAIRAMDTTVASHALAAMVEWFAFAHFELGEPRTEDIDFDRAVDTLTDLWLHALFGRVEPALLS
ncbi:MAG TPA: TetR/AcrR family transcriptional regulator [Acidimicrobiales bacterium]